MLKQGEESRWQLSFLYYVMNDGLVGEVYMLRLTTQESDG